ncbi:complex I intermediate-associated protein CIA30, partial [Rickenella mellea]
MATSRWSTFLKRLNRSTDVLKDQTSRVLRMDGANSPSRVPIPLLNFRSPEDVQNLALGCDSDIGGTSSAKLDFVSDSNAPNGVGYGRLSGHMRLGVQSGLEGKLRSGYAGFRSKSRRTLFGELTDDISNHEFLALRLKVGGHPRTRNSYFVNLQTDAPVSGELWQHRLYFQRDDNSWENLFIPFSAFVLTSFGELTSGHTSIDGEQIRWVGISLLGGNAGVEGPFELGMDSIRAVNREDVTESLKPDPSAGTQWMRGPL